MPCSKMLVKSGRNLDGNNNKNFNVGDERSGMQVPVPPERCGGGDEAIGGGERE
jgi:hypothetical protein